MDAQDVRLAVKYCGGCNPYYDAAKAKAAIERYLGMKIPNYDAQFPPDICLLMKQCSSSCFPHPEQWSKFKTIMLERETDVASAAERMREAIEQLTRLKQEE